MFFQQDCFCKTESEYEPGDDNCGSLPLGALHLPLHHRAHTHHHTGNLIVKNLQFTPWRITWYKNRTQMIKCELTHCKGLSEKEKCSTAETIVVQMRKQESSSDQVFWSFKNTIFISKLPVCPLLLIANWKVSKAILIPTCLTADCWGQGGLLVELFLQPRPRSYHLQDRCFWPSLVFAVISTKSSVKGRWYC